MSNFEKKQIEMELRAFATRNFERPADCKNLDQVRFYIGELIQKINDMRTHGSHIPDYAYTLLAQYNARQNSMLYKDFAKSY
jgi:hypothetical protein